MIKVLLFHCMYRLKIFLYSQTSEYYQDHKKQFRSRGLTAKLDTLIYLWTTCQIKLMNKDTFWGNM